MRIYTRAGDSGETYCMALGTRVSKDHPLIEFIGSLDEANSFLGLAASLLSLAGAEDEVVARARSDLEWLQELLFRVGFSVTGGKPYVGDDDVRALEDMSDRYLEGVDIKYFIIPSGPPPVAAIHVARSVVRRAERRFVTVVNKGIMSDKALALTVLKVLNRMSDALFAMAIGVARALKAELRHVSGRALRPKA